MTEEYKLAVNSSLDPSQYEIYVYMAYQTSIILIYPITIVCETKGLKEFKLTGDVKILKKFGIE